VGRLSPLPPVVPPYSRDERFFRNLNIESANEMNTTTDFEEWWQDNEPDTHEEIYELYNCVQSSDGGGTYEINSDDEKTFVSGHVSRLALVSEKARLAFLRYIDRNKGDEELDIDSWYGLQVALAKDD